MMRSLYSGVAGLKNHQTKMDVVGNNIANVNTVGYKAGRTTFQDMLSQSIKGASSPTGNTGGINPLQIGLGMGVASVDNIFTGGSLQSTGKNTDLALDGDGFFMVKSGLETYYTRAGNFDFDSQGNYVIPGTGLQVMGWIADKSGNINTSTEPVPLTIPLSAAMPPKVTTMVGITGNLSATETKMRPHNIAVYDSEGIAHQAVANFTKIDNYTWSVEYYVEGTDRDASNPYSGTIVFDKNGKYLYDTFASQVTIDPTTTVPGSTSGSANPTVDPTSGPTTTTTVVNGVVTTTTVEINNAVAMYADAANSLEYTYDASADSYTLTTAPNTVYTMDNNVASPTYGQYVDIGGTAIPAIPTLSYYTYDTVTDVTTATPGGGTTCTFVPTNGTATMTIAPTLSALTQYGIASDSTASKQDGYTAGTLNRSTLTVNSTGIIYGQFSNGELMNLGQVSLAMFTNPAGLTKVGSSLFSESNNSGVARVGIPNEAGYGGVMASTLEMSNVDLSEEFTTMITTQRGFQANSRIITTSDSLLEELVNLKR